ncbi:type I restriction enzyme HsdR N-terminal domain-containing protein [Arachidicoccus soli]|uniref:Type I restriction enzyme HsdR N-terminal domain-containing protein n=1 Tax=Arachidicoccus soli TaxID=2341117 RepID=A0A386HPT1_9BACT|nr:type I restriction enzyme HsdR N-terminal domain-containing protein [Arachidicoccus soli]AYD47958.1 type I restriction enzyme HsdR N-terminal domain-containing protein [Arachidicoccus soli]
MLSVNFPPPDFKIKKVEDKEQIWDANRKKWVRLTPEEWVRQNFIQFLINEKKYPASLISIEKEIVLGEMKKRYDIVVFKNALPWMIVECKEMNVPLSENVIEQIWRYNSIIVAPFIIITNGREHFGWEIKEGRGLTLKQLPEW